MRLGVPILAILGLTTTIGLLAGTALSNTTEDTLSPVAMLLPLIIIGILVTCLTHAITASRNQARLDLPSPAEDQFVQSTRKAYSNPDEYGSYADGEIDDDLLIEEDLFDFKSRHGFVDRKLWWKISSMLDRAIEQRKKVLAILDVGCGPGLWLLRMAAHCRRKGVSVRGCGIDLAPAMLAKARRRLARYRRLYPHYDLILTFEEGDARKPLPFRDRTFDLVTCIYTVLDHLPTEDLQQAIDEMLRVAKFSGANLTTVRGAGGPETSYICPREQVRAFQQVGDKLTFLDLLGEQRELISHLFSYDEVARRFAGAGNIEDVFGMDFLVSKIMDPNHRFLKAALPRDKALLERLIQREDEDCRWPDCIDGSAHIVVETTPKVSA